MKIIIRVDGGTEAEIGTGHVKRAILLADGLNKSSHFSDANLVIATRTSSEFSYGVNRFSEKGFQILNIGDAHPNSYAEYWLMKSANPDIVIFDRLDTSEDIVNRLKSDGIKVITIDDAGAGQIHADLTINPLVHDVQLTTHTFIGYDYLILPSINASLIVANDAIENIFVCFGGFDYRNLTLHLLQCIPKINYQGLYTVIIGISDDRVIDSINKNILDIMTYSDIEIRLFIQPDNFYELLSNCDLAIVSGGLTALDAARYGKPSIGIPQYRHQLYTLEKLQEMSVTTVADKELDYDTEDTINVINNLIANKQLRQQQTAAGLKNIDGKGLSRVIKLIDGLA